MERTLPGDRLSVGVAHSENVRSARNICRQKHGGPHTQADGECVTLFGSNILPEGEAFPIVAPGGELSC